MSSATHHEHHALPTSGSALNSVAFSATLHCLTGCAIGEVVGMIIGTALGFSNLGTIVLSVALAFLFGYSLTSLPLLRAGLALAAVVPIALATDTFSIAVMEVVDNGIMVLVPGAMEAGLGDILFWGALSMALVIAGVVAFPVNRWLITKGKGHAVLHETGVHGGPPTRVVAFIAALAAAFGGAVLVGEAVGKDEPGGGMEMSGGHGGDEAKAGGGHESMAADPVRGLSVTENGLTLDMDRTELPRRKRSELRFRILDSRGKPVRDFEVEHDRRMHLIVARRDLGSFQHLHPKLNSAGAWVAPIEVDQAGSYRVFADFKRGGRNYTLASDVAVDGPFGAITLPDPGNLARIAGGYEVTMRGGTPRAGRETELGFDVTRGGKRVAVEDYLGAKGHLVALRQGDLAYLHVHPVENSLRFETKFPTPGNYRLFVQFKADGRVHTAAFTQRVVR